MTKPPLPPFPPNRSFKVGWLGGEKETEESKRKTREWRIKLEEWRQQYGDIGK